MAAVADSGPGWTDRRVEGLDDGDIDALVVVFAELELTETDRAAVDKQLGYFQTNRTRMTYGTFREAGLFVGSGVVEARLQDDHCSKAEAIRDAMDHQRRHRHIHAALRTSQRNLERQPPATSRP